MFYERVRLSFEFGSQVKSESCRHTDLEARPVITQLDHFEKVYSPNICINFVLTFFFCFVTTKCQKCINYQIRLVQSQGYLIYIHSYFGEASCRVNGTRQPRRVLWVVVWVLCFSKKFERMAGEAMAICLRVLKETNKSRFESYSVKSSVLCIFHITFGNGRVHIFSYNLSRNSCI